MRWLIFLIFTNILFAQSTLTVKVNEHFTQSPISGVTVQLQQDATTTTVETDSTGTARLTFTPTGLPAQGVLTERPQRLELYNVLGQKIAVVQNYKQLNLNRLAAGVYILRAVYKHKTFQAKSVILNGRALNANWNGILQRQHPAMHALAKPAAGQLHLFLTKDGFTSFDTTFAAPQSDTTLFVRLHKYNRLLIQSQDVHGNAINMPFQVKGLSYAFEHSGDSLTMFSGRYRLQSLNPDTLQPIIDTVQVVSDTLLQYVFAPVQKHLLTLTFKDTSDENPLSGLKVELRKADSLRYAWLTDSAGTVNDSVFAGIYRLQAFGADVKPLDETLEVTSDIMRTMHTDEKDSVIARFVYPDKSPHDSLTVKVNGVVAKHLGDGKYLLMEYDGNYTMNVNGTDIEPMSISFSVKGVTTLEDTLKEIINLSDPNINFNEGDSSYAKAEDFASSPSGIKEARFESLDSLLVINNNWFKGLHVNTSGNFNYMLTAIAKHGTEKYTSFSAIINNMRTFEGHIYELLPIYENKDTVSFPGVVEIYYNPVNVDTFYTDENGHFHFTLPEGTKFAFIKYYTIDENDNRNSFVVTYNTGNGGASILNKQEDWVNIGLMVTRFDGLITGYSVPDKWAVERTTFKEFFKEVNSREHGLTAINYENNKYPFNPERNPDAKGRYRVYIPLDQAANSGLFSGALEIGPEEQEEIYQACIDSVDSKIPDPNMRPEFYKMSSSDTLPIWFTKNGYMRPEFRTFIYVKRTNYGYSFFDMAEDGEGKGDGIIDGGIIYAYEPWTVSFFAEMYSGVLSAPYPVYYDDFTHPDDIKLKTIYLEQYNTLFFTHYLDKKYTYDIIFNISNSFTTDFEYNGIKFVKFNYYPFMPEDYILGDE